MPATKQTEARARHTLRTPNATGENQTVIFRTTLAEAMGILFAIEIARRASRASPRGDNDDLGAAYVCLDRSIGAQHPEYYAEMRGYPVEKAGQKCERLQPVEDMLYQAAPEMLDALKYAAELIKIARHRFPKSVRNPDKFQLENTCATIGKAIYHAGGGTV